MAAKSVEIVCRMLPQFPKFKELELSDAEDVQRCTARYAPFSDFNFACLWSWNIDSSVLLSELNGNLVVRLGDYVNGQVFYSFLGDSRVNDTVEALIINVDRKTRSINLSIKAKDQVEQNEAMNKLSADTSSASSGTTNLGALLKAKLSQQ